MVELRFRSICPLPTFAAIQNWHVCSDLKIQKSKSKTTNRSDS